MEGWDEALATIKKKEATLSVGQKILKGRI